MIKVIILVISIFLLLAYIIYKDNKEHYDDLLVDPTLPSPSIDDDGPYVGALYNAGGFNNALYYPDAGWKRNSDF